MSLKSTLSKYNLSSDGWGRFLITLAISTIVAFMIFGAFRAMKPVHELDKFTKEYTHNGVTYTVEYTAQVGGNGMIADAQLIKKED